MRSRIVGWMTLAVLLTHVLVGCGPQPTSGGSSGPNSPEPTARDTHVGSPLYAPAPYPEYKTIVSRREPIIIPNALAQFEERQILSAEVDGTIDLFASYPKAGEIIPDDLKVYHPRDLKKELPLKRLTEGDEVVDGQILVFLDDRQIAARIKGAREIKASAEVALQYATDGAKEAEKRRDIVKRGVQEKGVIALTELIDAELTLARFRENEANARQTIAKTNAELTEAEVALDKHRIRSRVNGIIRSISKRPGEYVKAGDKIMEIEATDRVRIEGQLAIQYLPLLKEVVARKEPVIVEPAVPSAPLVSHNGHRRAVTGVAVTAHPEGPLVVSVGADGAALVWDPNLGKKTNRPAVPHSLIPPSNVGIRCVAASPPAAKSVLVITGADDGKISLWNLADRDRLPTSPHHRPDDAHTAAVQCLAFSPDGEFFASAAGREVFIWQTATARKLYALPDEHRDTITAVSFTPQNTLVTASKDGTIKIWKLGTERAAVVRSLDHRAGTIDVLTVSRDGGRILFDQDKTRIDLVDAASGQTVGQIENVSSAGAFSTVAIFGPDEVVAGLPIEDQPYTIATAGGDGDLKGTLQFWQAPRNGGRGSEIGRLITPGRAPITTAAFSPVRNEPFIVVGTAAGGVHLWKPTATRKAHTGRITYIDATDTRYVTVRVEMSNKELNLPDHSAATIIINPPNP